MSSATRHGRNIALATLAAALSACVTTSAGGGLHTPVSLGSASELAQTLNHVFRPRPSPDDGLRRATRVADGELADESAAPATTEPTDALTTQTAPPGNRNTDKEDPWRCARTPGARGCERRHGEDLVIAQPDIHAAPGGLPAPAEAARSCRIQCDGQWHGVSCASDADARCDCHAEPVAQCVDKPL